jgi:glycyl-tRNA synthetase beta subunit
MLLSSFLNHDESVVAVASNDISFTRPVKQVVLVFNNSVLFVHVGVSATQADGNRGGQFHHLAKSQQLYDPFIHFS